MRQLVYFIRMVGADFVKIGISEFPHTRLEQLQAGSPMPLEIVAMEYGGRNHEQALHKRFSDQHARQEWFTFSGPIAEHLATDNADTVICVHPGCGTRATQRGRLCVVHQHDQADAEEQERQRDRKALRRAQREARIAAVHCLAPDCHALTVGQEYCDEHKPSDVVTIKASPDDPRLQIRAPRPTDWSPNPVLHPGTARRG